MGQHDFRVGGRPSGTRNGKRDRNRNGKGGSVLFGLSMGAVIGLVAAAGLVWLLLPRAGDFRTVEPAPEAQVLPTVHPAPAATAAPVVEPPTPAVSPDYTFYDILPGNRAVRPQPPAATPTLAPTPTSMPTQSPSPSPAHTATPLASPPAVSTPAATTSASPNPAAAASPTPARKAAVAPPYWVQIAALKSEADAEALRARVSLLGLPAVVRRSGPAEDALFRVRVGPFAAEADAKSARERLAANDFEARLLKDSVNP